MLSTLQIATYSAVLSTLLALVRFWEIFKDRLKISITVGWDNLGPDITEVQITSHYKQPLTIVLFDLYWAKNKRSIAGSRELDLGMETGCLIPLPPFSTKSLRFDEQYAFGIKPGNDNLYARLLIAGRKRPITILAHRG